MSWLSGCSLMALESGTLVYPQPDDLAFPNPLLPASRLCSSVPRCSASSRVYNANHAIIMFLRIRYNYKSPQGPQRLQFVYLIHPCRATFPGLSALLGARISPTLQQSPDLSSRSREGISPEKGQLVSCFRFEEPPSAQLVKNLLKLLKCHLPWHVLNSRHISPSPHPFGPQALAETSLKLKVSENSTFFAGLPTPKENSQPHLKALY